MMNVLLLTLLVGCTGQDSNVVCASEALDSGEDATEALGWSTEDLPSSLEDGTWRVAWSDSMPFTPSFDTVEMQLTPRGAPEVHHYLESRAPLCHEGDLYLQQAYDGVLHDDTGALLAQGEYLVSATSPAPGDVTRDTIGVHALATVPDGLLAVAEAEARDFGAESYDLRVVVSGTQAEPMLSINIEMSGPNGTGGGSLARGTLSLED